MGKITLEYLSISLARIPKILSGGACGGAGGDGGGGGAAPLGHSLQPVGSRWILENQSISGFLVMLGGRNLAV